MVATGTTRFARTIETTRLWAWRTRVRVTRVPARPLIRCEPKSDERFAEMIRQFREDSIRREAATHKAFRDIRTVGLSIVKTLNLHTRILERIDRKLGVRGNGRPEIGRGT